MKLRKTYAEDRKTYTYFFTDGKPGKFTLYPESMKGQEGIPTTSDPGYLVTFDFVSEEFIKELHSADDREVYNNLKNTRIPLNKKTKLLRDEWMEAHPGEHYNGNLHISLDAVRRNASGDCMTEDKSPLFKAVYEAAVGNEEDDNPLLARVQEIIDEFPKEWQSVYALLYKEEYNNTKIAEILGCSEGNIRKKRDRIKKKVEADPVVRELYRISHANGDDSP